MNVGYIYYSEYSQKNSSGTQIINTVNALSDCGCEVTLFATSSISDYMEYHDISLDGSIATHPFLTGVDTVDRASYYALSLARSLRNGVDVIYTRDISLLRFLTVVPDRLCPPVVYEAHKAYHRLDYLSASEERDRLGQADGVVVLSEGIQADIESLGVTVDAIVRDAANAEHIPSPSKQDLRETLDMPHSEPIFVYAGSLYSSKYDIEGLIDAFHSLSQRRDCSLYIVGGNESNVATYRQYVDDIGAAETIHLVGHVSQSRVFEYLKAADIGIVAQQPTDLRASKYTSPLKLFEYLALGLVVVATEVPSISEIADTESRIFTYTPNDTDSLEDALDIAANESSDSQSGEPRQEYTYEHRARTILSVLEQHVHR